MDFLDPADRLGTCTKFEIYPDKWWQTLDNLVLGRIFYFSVMYTVLVIICLVRVILH